MKHDMRTTLILIMVFFAAQMIGLLVISHYVVVEQTETGINVQYKEVPFVGVPPAVDQTFSFIPIMVAILLGTAFIFVLMKLRKPIIFRFWIAFVIFLTMSIAFFAFTDSMTLPFAEPVKSVLPLAIAVGLSVIITYFKIFRPNVFAHNFAEIFIYGGIAVIFVPVLNLVSVIILLILISIYDIIAVWKSGHMITLAKFQAESKAFAGLMIPYGKGKLPQKLTEKKKKEGIDKEEARVGILGGGDIAFPLIFAGVIMKTFGMQKALIIPVFATIALAILFVKADKDKFYPAMPFISAGCFVGLAIALLL